MSSKHHRHSQTHAHLERLAATRRQFLSSLTSATVVTPWALGQSQTPVEMAESFRQRSENAELKGLAASFKGVTTDGNVIPNLFQISPSGVSTESVRNAAERFIASLTDVQSIRTMFPIGDIQLRKWMNQNHYARQGASFEEMTGRQHVDRSLQRQRRSGLRWLARWRANEFGPPAPSRSGSPVREKHGRRALPRQDERSGSPHRQPKQV